MAANRAAGAAERVESNAERRVVPSDLLREIYHPWLPVLDPAVRKWNHGLIIKLAQAAYEQRSLPSGHLDVARLAVLADALEEAGVSDSEILGHLRSPAPHIPPGVAGGEHTPAARGPCSRRPARQLRHPAARAGCRAGTAVSPRPCKALGGAAGLSVQLFGLALLGASLAGAIYSRSVGLNLIGVVVLAVGYYLCRGSRAAGGWAAGLMALFVTLFLLSAILTWSGEDVSLLDMQIPPKDPWAVGLGLAAAAWAAVNVLLAIRFLRRAD